MGYVIIEVWYSLLLYISWCLAFELILAFYGAEIEVKDKPNKQPAGAKKETVSGSIAIATVNVDNSNN